MLSVDLDHSKLFFFFKQKTAYEIGLGIPAEPLFRSQVSEIMRQILTSRLSLSKHLAHNLGNLLLLGKIGVFHNRRNASKIGRASCRERVKISVCDIQKIKEKEMVQHKYPE